MLKWFLETRKENWWKKLTQFVWWKELHPNKQWIVTEQQWNDYLDQKEIKFWKYEVLLRVSENWNPVNLWEFLESVEKYNLEFQLDVVVLEKTLLRIAEKQREGDTSTYQINVYPATFCDDYFKEFISYLIEKTKVQTQNIVFELLESWRSCESFCTKKQKAEWCDCNINANIDFLLDEYWIKTAIDDFWNWNNNTKLLEMVRGYKIVKIDWIYLDKLFKELSPEDFTAQMNTLVSYLHSKWIEEITFEKIDSTEKFIALSLLNKLWLKISYQWWLFSKGETL